MIGKSKEAEDKLSKPTIEFITKGDEINFPKKGFVIFVYYKGWV